MHCLDSVSLRPSFFTNLSHQNQARKYSAFRRELLLPLSLSLLFLCPWIFWSLFTAYLLKKCSNEMFFRLVERVIANL